MRKKVILIPGNGGGTVNDHWFPYVRNELRRMGVEVISENFPDPMLARAEYWLPHLNSLKADPDTILVGHSSGAVAAMRYAETNRVWGSILVAANYTHMDDYHEKISGYYDRDWDWNSIKNNQQWIAQFSSLDDPYIPIEEPRHISTQLGSDYYEYDNHGHFGEDIFKTEFPEIITIIKNKLS